MNSILVVDDEKPARKELRYLIENIVGMTDILEARSGHEALKLIQSNPINIAFIDINLGDMDGITLAKEGKKITGNLKVIFSTAYDAYAVKAFEINAVDYIMKPFEQQRVEEIRPLEVRQVGGVFEDDGKGVLHLLGQVLVAFEDVGKIEFARHQQDGCGDRGDVLNHGIALFFLRQPRLA